MSNLNDVKDGRLRYASRWDWWTWLIVGILAVCTVVPWILDEDGWIPALICGVALVVSVLILLGTYYVIDGDNLEIYSLASTPIVCPISRIESIRETDNIISSPATAFTKRLEIKFTDRYVWKGRLPLLISPVHPEDFVRRLLAINPDIKLGPKLARSLRNQ